MTVQEYKKQHEMRAKPLKKSITWHNFCRQTQKKNQNDKHYRCLHL